MTYDLRESYTITLGTYDNGENMGKFIDLTGQKFGRLTVINRQSKKGISPIKWNCECECGNKCIVSSASLLYSNTKSCGCLQRERTSEACIKNLIGQRFGRLVVLERAENYKRKVRWKCKCDCGNQVIVNSGELLNNVTQSCGCLQKERAREYRINHRKLNEYDLSGEYGIGYTHNKNSEGINYFYFDKEDYDKIKNYTWRFGSNDFVLAYGNDNKIIMLHRIIMNVSDLSLQVDHIKHKRYDNRKSELRIVEQSKNQMNIALKSNNTSGTTGVYWDKIHNYWTARITENKNIHFLGSFDNKEEAIKARKEAEEKYFGEYSYDNSMKIGAN